MKDTWLLVSAFVLFVVGASLPWALESRPHPALFTLRIDMPSGSGSGIALASHQDLVIVLTAGHVVEGEEAANVRVQLGDLSWPAVRIEKHPTLDLAAIWIQSDVPTVPYSTEKPGFGARAQVSGYQFGEFMTVAEGLISGDAVSVDSLPGASGGPVFCDGRVIGIVTRSLRCMQIPIGASATFVPFSDAEEWISGILRR